MTSTDPSALNPDPDCIFCKIVAGAIPSHKVYEDEDVLAFLDIHAVARGHTLVIPRQHAPDLEGMDLRGLDMTTRATQTVARILRTKLKADGLNVRQNNGRAAGQDVFHYHVHLIPRWQNDGGYSFSRPAPTDHTALGELAAMLRG